MSKVTHKRENQNAKEKKTETEKKYKSEQRKKSLIRYDKLVFIATLAAGLASVYYIRQWMEPPVLPEVNLQEYWGTYPMEVKPDNSIHTFKIEFSYVIVNDLKERLLHRRTLPQPLENAGFTYGFNSNFLSQVVSYWANSYNFQERERFLNQYNHFVTKVNGLRVHYMHVKPQRDENIEYEVVPLLMLHGWPGSFREFYEVIPLLTRQGKKNFVFEIIVPSLPGFGYSEAPTRPGFGAMEMAIVIHNLMDRIGIPQYYIQGGDVGHTVGSIMATLFPQKVLGFHTNLPVVAFNPTASVYHLLGALIPSWMEEPHLVNRLYPYSDVMSRTIEETGYMHIQATKPDTIGAALSDSPAGLAAYILEKFSTWTNPEFRKAYDGHLLNKFTLLHLLDNVMIYWTTNTITTSMRIYAETLNKRMIPFIFDRYPTEVPTWGLKFRHELMYHTDRMLRLKYSRYIQSSTADDGGHFAAMENPEILATDVFDAVQAFRLIHGQNETLSPKPGPEKEPETVYDFTVNNINGEPISLESYKGYVLLIVNVASQCGLTDTNYKQLNELHKKYYDKGLRILAFPCNQFNGQEPGSSKEILEFKEKMDVKLDLFEKVNVNGDDAAPLWKFLKKVQSGTLGDFIKWNFSKFVVDREGVPVMRFGSNIHPKDIEKHLFVYL